MGHQLTKRIGIDLDSTIVDYLAGLKPELREFLAQPAECRLWTKQKRNEFYVKERFFRNLPPIDPRPYEFTAELVNNMGYKVYSITARTPHPEIVEDTHHWLGTHKLLEHCTDTLFTNEKANLCKLMEIPIMVEDEPKHIKNCLSLGIDVVARAQPWNKEIGMEEYPARYFRVREWEEMIEAIKEIE